MDRNTPKIIDIALGAEINCYPCADLEVCGYLTGSSRQNTGTADACTVTAAPLCESGYWGTRGVSSAVLWAQLDALWL
ncbi:pyrroloquinoline quinone precursor peptide PqqA [Paraburkholderia phymatum]|uniref:Pyrroloquinoline quinone peptide PqqA n=1 Tax=Paraburkholderia phymatum TaxID=148447 RepID=A0ACC6UA76_9BURK